MTELPAAAAAVIIQIEWNAATELCRVASSVRVNERSRKSGRISKSSQLLPDDRPEGRQADLDRVPDEIRGHVLVIVPVDIAGARHAFPRDRRMPLFQRRGQATRGFGNDLETTSHGVDRAQVVTKRAGVETRRESLGKVDVMENVA